MKALAHLRRRRTCVARSRMPATAAEALDWQPASLVAAHLSDGRDWSAADPGWPVVPRVPGPGNSHVQFPCPGCGQMARVLIEGGAKPGDEIEAGCNHCGTASSCLVRAAMFA